MAETSDARGSGSRLVLEKGPGKAGSLPRRLLRALALLVGAAFVGGLLLVAVAYLRYSKDLPDIPQVEAYRPPIVSELWTSDGLLAGEFYDERRKVIPYERIPKKLIQAFIAAEDERFFDHSGFDPLGMTRAAFKTYFQRKRVQGGSTLTQQTAKAILVSNELAKVTDDLVLTEARARVTARKLEPEAEAEALRLEALKVHAELRREAHARATEKKLRRKIKELFLAFRLEEEMTKEEILYLYLNNVYLGHHSYGVESGAENYFRKSVDALTLGEMTFLAGLPQAPTANSPWARPARAKERRSYVLRRMLEAGMISEKERAEADAENPKVYPVEDQFRDFSPFFSEQVRRSLVSRYGNERMLKDGLQVYAAMDSERQRAAQVAMLDGLIAVDKRQGYTGTLGRLTAAEVKPFDEKLVKALGQEKLTAGSYYVGRVEKLDSAKEMATIAIGNERAYLSILGMRWARPVNPDAYYPSSLINHVSQALSEGDVIVVKVVERKALLEEDADPRYVKLLPAEGTLVTLEQSPQLQGALISVDPSRGYVVAMVGGYDFDASEFNRAYQACRQPGSSFKPVIYSAAIERLHWQPNQVLVDAPIVFDDPRNMLRWKPENFGSDFKGDVLLRTALINSMNVPAVKTLSAVGVGNAMEWARKLGITTPINPDLSMALGGSCVQPAELVGVFATIDRGGTRFRPTFLRKVSDRFGRTLEDHSAFDDPFASFEERLAAGFERLVDKPERVMTPETAFITKYLLRDVVRNGTGTPAKKLGKPAGGKTGTTNDSFDTWFIGFTQDLVAGVWLGYDRYERPLGKYETGGRASLPIWTQYMSLALGEREQPEFTPEGANISWVRVDSVTGLRANAETPSSLTMPFAAGFEPTDVAPEPGASDPDQFMFGVP